jgi:hypothetical protein
MKKMLAMLILGASIALPAAAFAAEQGTDNHPDGTVPAAPVYLQSGPTDSGTVAGPGQQRPSPINWIHGDRD